MDKNTKILLYGGLSVVALILVHKRVLNKMYTKEVPFEPTEVEKMTWITDPNVLPEIKVDGKSNY